MMRNAPSMKGSPAQLPRQRARVETFVIDEIVHRAAALWRNGLDTLAIAKQLGIPEVKVWNQIEVIKAVAGRGGL
jgi:hypothetical protein